MRKKLSDSTRGGGSPQSKGTYFVFSKTPRPVSQAGSWCGQPRVYVCTRASVGLCVCVCVTGGGVRLSLCVQVSGEGGSRGSIRPSSLSSQLCHHTTRRPGRPWREPRVPPPSTRQPVTLNHVFLLTRVFASAPHPHVPGALLLEEQHPTPEPALEYSRAPPRCVGAPQTGPRRSRRAAGRDGRPGEWWGGLRPWYPHVWLGWTSDGTGRIRAETASRTAVPVCDPTGASVRPSCFAQPSLGDEEGRVRLSNGRPMTSTNTSKCIFSTRPHTKGPLGGPCS